MREELTLAEIAGALRRQKRLAVGVTLVGTVLSLVAAWAWPPVYTATARILVESQQIPAELARSTVTAGAAERLGLIEERLMTRDNLLDIADRLDLFAARPWLTTGERVEAMRAATSIEPVALDRQSGRRGPATVLAFTISFSARRADAAAEVANEFASRLFEQNRRQRTAQASETNAFFKQEVARLGTALADTERRIGEFKKANEAALPDALELRHRELLDLRARAFTREELRIELRGELRQLAERLAAGPGASAETPEARELAALERQLAERGAVLSGRHPQIRALTAKVAALRARVTAADAGPGGLGGEKRRLRLQADRAEEQLALLDQQERADRQRQAELEASNALTPRVEAALAQLHRRLADLQAQHRIAVQKQAEAATGEKLELGRQAERVEVIERATVPERRDSPNRGLIAAGGAAASAMLGLTLALLAEFSGSAIRDAADLERQLGFAPLSAVPVIGAGRGPAWRRMAAAVLVLGLAGTALAVGGRTLPVSAKAGVADLLRTVDGHLG